jgi:hypothetical protein
MTSSPVEASKACVGPSNVASASSPRDEPARRPANVPSQPCVDPT